MYIIKIEVICKAQYYLTAVFPNLFPLQSNISEDTYNPKDFVYALFVADTLALTKMSDCLFHHLMRPLGDMLGSCSLNIKMKSSLMGKVKFRGGEG